jgi:PAS domain S-box-containing protein
MINSQPPQYILLVAADHTADKLSAMLTVEGYHVISTERRESAFEMHRLYRPALTVIDCGLKHFDAAEFCGRLRGEAFNFLCILPAKQTDRIDKLLAAGASDCILMPLNPRLLRQRAYNLLRVSHQTIHAQTRMLDCMLDAAMICDGQGRIFAANNRFYSLSGYENGDLNGSNAFDLFISDSSAMSQVVEGLTIGNAMQLEVRLRRKNLSYLPIVLYMAQMDDGRLLWVVRDLREQQQTQITLQESEHRYHDLFNSANDAILIVDIVTGRFLDANKLAARWLGYSREELLSLSFDVIDVPMSQQQQDVVKRELSTNGRLIYEQYYRRRDGTLIPVEVSSRLIRFDGRRAFLCFARDITRRREMEEAERTQRMVAEALSATAAILNSSLDFDQIIETMLDLISNVISADAVNFMRIMGNDAVVTGIRGYDRLHVEDKWHNLRIPLDQAEVMRWMAEQKRPISVPDTEKEEGWFAQAGQEWIRSYVGAPIIVEDQVMGFLNLDGKMPNQFNEQHADTLLAFANQAGIALQNARLFQKVQNYADELENRVGERTVDLQEQIRERERAEKSLADERNLLRTLIDSLPDDVYVKDRQGRYLLLNQTIYKRLKRRKPEHPVLGGTDYDFMARQNADNYHHDEERLYATGQPILNQEVSDGFSPPKSPCVIQMAK